MSRNTPRNPNITNPGASMQSTNRDRGNDPRTLAPLGTSYIDKKGKTQYVVEHEAWHALEEVDRASMAMEFQNIVLPRILKARPEVQEAVRRSVKFNFEDLGSDEGMDIDDCAPTLGFLFFPLIVSMPRAWHTGFSQIVKVAVLNTAMWQNPGGMFERGSALEEDSLVPSVILSVKKKLYGRLAYSSSVRSRPLLLPPTQLFSIDVISCAPVAYPVTIWVDNKNTYLNKKHLDLMAEKIKGILRVAVASGCAILILGAFGCGAYKNPTEVVAEQMKLILTSINWKAKGIERVFIAINDHSPNQPVWDGFAEVFDGAAGVLVDHSGRCSLDMMREFTT
ncbi:hypothetical protein PV04_03891 [Phialophora macrospora]|uniref:Microbial-type PARG catalytic domain-containing protein n=1 Tax=Phialophora macrospora TaxID=1851006 RepID=A0A0D2EBT6_9EURO|nr:hypothetical protein PV04_03891 [Phialophora macrospora]